MKRIIFIFSVMLSFSTSAFAQTDVVKHANDLYSKGDYKAAAEEYENIIAAKSVAPELYYNLGNAYYKSDEIGHAILNYERSLRLKPNYQDARVNLEMAQQKVVDNVVQVPPFFVMRWIDLLMKLFTSNQWYVVSVIFLILMIVASLVFVFGYSVAHRKTSFYIAVVLLCLTVLTMFFAGIRKNQMVHHTDAIIMSGAVIVKGSPDKSGTDLFQLHEGTKVKVKSSLGKWTEIVLGNGNIGWVEDENIERI